MILLYSNREAEIDEYAYRIAQANLSAELMVCRSPEDVKKVIAEADIIFGVHLPADAYTSAKQLRWIQSMWAGVEGLLSSPLPEGVIVTKPWGVFGPYLSHYVFGNILAQKINLPAALRAQEQCLWHPYRIELLHGKCIGIAGLGNVAEDIARTARAFGMEVWALNTNGRANPLAQRIFCNADREDFVAGADVLVLTLPLTPATRGMFDAKLLSKMKQDAWLVNVGRGALIDDEALMQVLIEKRIAGAILDVFQEEPLPASHPYWRLPNCIVTPHIGGPSLPADICACFLENFKRFENGETLLGLIDLRRGY